MALSFTLTLFETCHHFLIKTVEVVLRVVLQRSSVGPPAVFLHLDCPGILGPAVAHLTAARWSPPRRHTPGKNSDEELNPLLLKLKSSKYIGRLNKLWSLSYNHISLIYQN